MYRLSGNVRSAHHENSGVILDIEHGRIFTLNTVGSRILELVKEGLQEPEIAGRIASEFGGSFEVAVNDAAEFLGTLTRHGVIVKTAGIPIR